MLSLNNAIVKDIETFPNVFTFAMEFLNNSTRAVWEISPFRDDRTQLFEFWRWAHREQVPMIGFNNISWYKLAHSLLVATRSDVRGDE